MIFLLMKTHKSGIYGRERDGGREGRDVGRGDGIHDTAIAPDAAAALASPPAQPPCSPLLRPRHRPACCCTRRARQTMTPASGFDSGFGFGSGLDSGSGFGSGAIGTGGSPIGVLQNDALLKSSSASLSSLRVDRPYEYLRLELESCWLAGLHLHGRGGFLAWVLDTASSPANVQLRYEADLAARYQHTEHAPCPCPCLPLHSSLAAPW
jgi:hypothetical protein